MVILHLATIWNDMFNGISVAVPRHVLSQKEFATVAIINVNGKKINALAEYPELQITCEMPVCFNKLPEPFRKPDLVIFHECYRREYLQISRELKRNNIPYVIMPHGELRREAQKKKWLKKKIANLLLFRSFTEQALAIQCLSEDEKNSTYFGKNRFVGTNGIEMPQQCKETFSEKGVKFLYIGRYEWRVKGFDLLFAGIRQEAAFLREHGCKFYMYGPDIKGRFAQVTDLIKKYEVEDLIELNHEISGEEKIKTLLSADIFIQTSRHEGMPMGILEAMSYGLPCLVTEGTALGKQIEEANAGWDAGRKAQSIAKAICCAVEQREEWKIKGENGRRYVADHYEWGLVSEKTVETYQKLLSR